MVTPGVHAPTLSERLIRRRIARRGPITFAEYMARALHGPGGYYTRADRNPLDDYYTSPQVHPAFGALLAVQLFQCWALLGRPAPFVVVEAGAGDGLLCRDILTAAAWLPTRFADAMRYIVSDRQTYTGREHGGREHGLDNAHRIVADALRLPIRNVTGCVLSNELLDALPVHRVRMEKHQLRELYVDIAPDVADGYEGILIERAGEPSTPLLAQRLAEAEIALEDGQTAEICLQLDAWANSIALTLQSGFALTIDYGRTASDLYDPDQRRDGTLVTYRNHTQTDTPLVDAGRQDITAQVDFTAVQRAGEQAGLTTIGNVPQGLLLQQLGLQTIRRTGQPSVDAMSGWQTLPVGPDGELPDFLPGSFVPDPFASGSFATPPNDGRAWLAALTHLTRPGGLGDFRVLMQSKAILEPTAAQALGWLTGGDAEASDYTPASYTPASYTPASHTPAALAAMIPADSLRFGAERLPLFG